MALESENIAPSPPPASQLTPPSSRPSSVDSASTGSVSPSNSPSQHSSLPSPKLNLSFSIENILRLDFCKKDSIARKRNDFPQESGPKSPASSTGNSTDTESEGTGNLLPNPSSDPSKPVLWPAWVYCTRYSDRPSSGPRSRKMKKREKKNDEKRPRTAFTNDQLQRLKKEFIENRYLTEKRRQELAKDLNLNESQIKIWFQNKRAKIKKSSGERNPLALSLMAQGLYNHATNQGEGEGEDED